MSYWDATDRYLEEHGGSGPPCPYCGKEMFAADDHGRFSCFCRGLRTFDSETGIEYPTPRIPQVDTSGMTDEEKARIPPINRLYGTPTAAEARFFEISSHGPDAMDDPEYLEASRVLDEERKKQTKVNQKEASDGKDKNRQGIS